MQDRKQGFGHIPNTMEMSTQTRKRVELREKRRGQQHLKSVQNWPWKPESHDVSEKSGEEPQNRIDSKPKLEENYEHIPYVIEV